MTTDATVDTPRARCPIDDEVGANAGREQRPQHPDLHRGQGGSAGEDERGPAGTAGHQAPAGASAGVPSSSP